eukprot:761161-Hanusia_phi.AAC.10
MRTDTMNVRCFSSQIRSETLILVNTLPSTVKIISAESTDPRLELTLKDFELEPSSPTIAGFVILDVDNVVRGETYLMWANRKSLFVPRGAFVDDIDIVEYNLMHDRWNEMVARRGTEMISLITFKLNVSLNVRLKVTASISLPEFLPGDRDIFFGTVYAGSWTAVNQSFENPSSLTTFFKLVLPNASMEPAPQGFYICQTERSCFMESDFLIPAYYMQGFVISRRSSINLTDLIFAPKKAGQYRAKMYIRSNLTALIEFSLTGIALEPALIVQSEGSKFCNLSRNASSSSCRFHLSCHENQTSSPTDSDGLSSFLRSFKISNPASLPILISRVVFDGRRCAKQGLTLQDCEASREVNQSQSLTLRVQGKVSYCEKPTRHTVVIHTSVGKFRFELHNREDVGEALIHDVTKGLVLFPAHYSHCFIAGVSMSILILAFTYQVKQKTRARSKHPLRQIRIPALHTESRSYLYETELHLKFLQNRKKALDAAETSKAQGEKAASSFGKLVGKGKVAKAGALPAEAMDLNGTPKMSMGDDEKGSVGARPGEEDRAKQANHVKVGGSEGKVEKQEEERGQELPPLGEKEEGQRLEEEDNSVLHDSEEYEIFIPKPDELISGTFGSLDKGEKFEMKEEGFGVVPQQEPLGALGRDMLNPDFPLDELQPDIFASQDFEPGSIGSQGVVWEPIPPPAASLLPDASAP